MVSGLVTSPCDQLRIFSGLASWILMASKSAMGPVSSKGLERNIFCVSLVSCACRCSDWLRLLDLFAMTCGASRYRWFWCWCLSSIVLPLEVAARGEEAGTSSVFFSLVCCGDGWQRRLLLIGELDQLDVQAERLQFADKNVERLGNTWL